MLILNLVHKVVSNRHMVIIRIAFWGVFCCRQVKCLIIIKRLQVITIEPFHLTFIIIHIINLKIKQEHYSMIQSTLYKLQKRKQKILLNLFAPMKTTSQNVSLSKLFPIKTTQMMIKLMKNRISLTKEDIVIKN